MGNKNLFLPSLIGGAVLAMVAKAAGQPIQGKPTPRYSTSDPSFAAVDAFLLEQMDHLNIPGAALAIVEGDQIVHFRGYGRARPGGEPPSPHTPFFIGSLTKSFTALAVMQLVEAGKVDLDAPVQCYLPWFRVAGPQESAPVNAAITVRHLLNQTSGLPMLQGMTILADLENSPDAAEKQARTLSTLRLAHPAGAAFEYSNLNYNLLGLIIEAASGESYADYIQRRIFDPLGMRHSYTSKAAAQQNGLAMGHRYWFGVPVAARNLPVPAGSLASGQLISCAEDITHYLIAQLNGGCWGNTQILSGAGIAALHHPAAEIREMGSSFGHYGMGWISMGTGANRIVSHSGIVPDFGAFMAILPEQKRGIVLLVNANHAMMKMTLDEVGIHAAQLLAGLPPAPLQFAEAPWLMRAMLLIPALQVLDAASTLWRLRHWQRNPAKRPNAKRVWGQHILLPLIPNLSFLAMLVFLLTSGFLRFMKLFMPDAYWITVIGGGFAGFWAFLRTGLILKAVRKHPPRGEGK